MLYLGNFSYSDNTEEGDNYCLMPAIVDAPDADTALERFADMLQKYHEESTLLVGAKDIYLDSLVEVFDEPEEPVLIQWQKIVASDEGLASVVSALPGDDDNAQAYSWGDMDEDDEGELVSLVDEDADDENDDAEDFDGDDELTIDDLADAISEALDYLMGSDLSFLDDEDLTTPEEPFLSFED